MNTAPTSTQVIQAILAPAVLVSASALFLLGLNARYVALLTRIRALASEKRKLLESTVAAIPDGERRLLSIEQQIRLLLRSIRYLNSAILCQVSASLFFVLTSCAIGLNFLLPLPVVLHSSIYLFVMGLLLILTGIFFLGADIFNAYPVIWIDVDDRQRV